MFLIVVGWHPAMGIEHRPFTIHNRGRNSQRRGLLKEEPFVTRNPVTVGGFNEVCTCELIWKMDNMFMNSACMYVFMYVCMYVCIYVCRLEAFKSRANWVGLNNEVYTMKYYIYDHKHTYIHTCMHLG